MQNSKIKERNKNMKRLTCEMCGSTDLIKQDGVFVCQSCGSKYSVEEAKKMMVEGIVDVTGSTVKVDISDELVNLYQIARRAREDNNSENAAKYYEMILIKDSGSWEANFYSVYYTAMSCKIGEIGSAANSVSSCIKGTFRLIRENIFEAEERKKAIMEVNEKVKELSKVLLNASLSNMKNIDPLIKSKFESQFLINSLAAGILPNYVCQGICDIFIDDEDVMSTIGIQILKERIASGIGVNYDHDYVKAIKKYDPTYQIPPELLPPDVAETNQTSSNTKGGGCYIATAVYGSYDCPEVWTLRRFRDYTLAATWYGRAFIQIYYAISPTLVKWFGHTEWFKKMWKNKLDCVVANLNARGVQDTPYEDRSW